MDSTETQEEGYRMSLPESFMALGNRVVALVNSEVESKSVSKTVRAFTRRAIQQYQYSDKANFSWKPEITTREVWDVYATLEVLKKKWEALAEFAATSELVVTEHADVKPGPTNKGDDKQRGRATFRWRGGRQEEEIGMPRTARASTDGMA